MEVFLFSFRLFVFQLNRPAVQLESSSFGGGMRSQNLWYMLICQRMTWIQRNLKPNISAEVVLGCGQLVAHSVPTTEKAHRAWRLLSCCSLCCGLSHCCRPRM